MYSGSKSLEVWLYFKQYQPVCGGDTSTKFTQLQRGSWCILVGFPKNQAGWLIYVQKIGNKNLVISADVVFDQFMLSSTTGTNSPFTQSQPEKSKWSLQSYK